MDHTDLEDSQDFLDQWERRALEGQLDLTELWVTLDATACPENLAPLGTLGQLEPLALEVKEDNLASVECPDTRG